MWLIVKQLTIKVDGWDASLALRDQPKESASFAFACIKLLLIIISWEITRGKLHDFNDNLIITPQKKQNPEVKRQQSYTVYPTKYVLIYVIAVHINNRPLFTGTRIAHTRANEPQVKKDTHQSYIIEPGAIQSAHPPHGKKPAAVRAATQK